MKLGICIVVVLLCASMLAQQLPNAPSTSRPKDSMYAAGFSTDNQFYMLQGWGVGMVVGGITKRPWLGAASGVGSCALYRIIHIQGYHNDKFFGQNRMEFCAAGAATSYVTMKLLHWGRPKRTPWTDKPVFKR